MAPDHCLWEAPPDMTTKASLQHLYTQHFGADQTNDVSAFFRDTLSIPDASWTDITDELKQLRKDGCEDFDRILGLYQYLNAMKTIAFDDEKRQTQPPNSPKSIQ
jgi:hypothetical protein